MKGSCAPTFTLWPACTPDRLPTHYCSRVSAAWGFFGWPSGTSRDWKPSFGEPEPNGHQTSASLGSPIPHLQAPRRSQIPFLLSWFALYLVTIHILGIKVLVLYILLFAIRTAYLFDFRERSLVSTGGVGDAKWAARTHPRITRDARPREVRVRPTTSSRWCGVPPARSIGESFPTGPSILAWGRSLLSHHCTRCLLQMMLSSLISSSKLKLS